MQENLRVIPKRNFPELILHFQVTLLLLPLFFSISSALAPSSLKLVQIVFRHGDRSPTGRWGHTDPNPESVWPQGWGQLSDLGKRQLFQLGGQIKERYKGFLSDEYKWVVVCFDTVELWRDA